jgi:hypothetical protein
VVSAAGKLARHPEAGIWGKVAMVDDPLGNLPIWAPS